MILDFYYHFLEGLHRAHRFCSFIPGLYLVQEDCWPVSRRPSTVMYGLHMAKQIKGL